MLGAVWAAPVVVTVAAAPHATASPLPDLTVKISSSPVGSVNAWEMLTLTYVVSNVGQGPTFGATPVSVSIPAPLGWQASGLSPTSPNPLWTFTSDGAGGWLATWGGGLVAPGEQLPRIEWVGQMTPDDFQVTFMTDVTPGSGGEVNFSNNHDQLVLTVDYSPTAPSLSLYSIGFGCINPSPDGRLAVPVVLAWDSYSGPVDITFTPTAAGTFTVGAPTGWASVASNDPDVSFHADVIGPVGDALFDVQFSPETPDDCLRLLVAATSTSLRAELDREFCPCAP